MSHSENCLCQEANGGSCWCGNTLPDLISYSKTECNNNMTNTCIDCEGSFFDHWNPHNHSPNTMFCRFIGTSKLSCACTLTKEQLGLL